MTARYCVFTAVRKCDRYKRDGVVECAKEIIKAN